MGLDVRFHEWSAWGYWGKNVEATLYDSSGTNDEIYVICAHYDSVPGSPGADDNGSGTAAVLAIADILSDYSFNTNIRFVAFSGEEQGLLGSHEYVEDAYNNGDNIVAALNMDMIGYAITQEHEKKIKVYYDGASQWLTTFTDNVAEQYVAYIDLEVIPSGYSWGSDHASFWDFGYHAIFYHEYKFNDYYHSPQDIIAHMNIPYLAKCTKLVLATTLELAGPFEFLPLKANRYTLSSRDADSIEFFLDGEPENAFRNYLLLGSASGTEPGTPLPGGSATLPLNWDAVTDFVARFINTPIFTDFMGALDGNGQAQAQLNTFGPLGPGFVGTELSFAFACDHPWDYVSNPISIEIVD
jgi:hypothetical protein